MKLLLIWVRIILFKIQNLILKHKLGIGIQKFTYSIFSRISYTLTVRNKYIFRKSFSINQIYKFIVMKIKNIVVD